MAEQPNTIEEEPIEGIVTARICDCCGHREISKPKIVKHP